MNNAFFSLLFALFLLLSCGSEKSSRFPTETEETIEIIEDISLSNSDIDKVNEPPPSPKHISFETENENGEYGPETILSIKIDDQLQEIKKVMGVIMHYDSTDYEEMEIPMTTIAACGAWFAGGGEYFYVVEENQELVIYQGWLDEMVDPDEGYHWEKLDKIEDN